MNIFIKIGLILLVSFSANAQSIKGKINYFDIYKSKKLPDADATISIYKYDSSIVIKSIYFVEYNKDYRIKEWYEYWRKVHGDKDPNAQKHKDEMDKLKITDEVIDTLNAKRNREKGKFMNHKPSLEIKRIKANQQGEYTAKLPIGRYYFLIESKNTPFAFYKELIIKNEDEIVENHDF